jgi:hypothetical protein
MGFFWKVEKMYIELFVFKNGISCCVVELNRSYFRKRKCGKWQSRIGYMEKGLAITASFFFLIFLASMLWDCSPLPVPFS